MIVTEPPKAIKRTPARRGPSVRKCRIRSKESIAQRLNRNWKKIQEEDRDAHRRLGVSPPIKWGKLALTHFWRMQLAVAIDQAKALGVEPTHCATLHVPNGMRGYQVIDQLGLELEPIFRHFGVKLIMIASEDISISATRLKRPVNMIGLHVDVLIHIPPDIWPHVHAVLTKLNEVIWAQAPGRLPNSYPPLITNSSSQTPVFIQEIDPAQRYGGEYGLAGMQNYMSKRYAPMADKTINMVAGWNRTACQISPVIIRNYNETEIV